MIYALLALISAALLGFDQWTKYWTTEHLALGESAPLFPGVIELLRVHNYGAAWSSFSGQRWLLLGVTGVIILVIVVLLVRRVIRHPLGLTACALILSGGIGNMIDRFRLGYVVDMLHFEFWRSYPVFNVADICVVCGAVLGSVYYIWFYDKYDAKPAKGDDHGTADSASQ